MSNIKIMTQDDIDFAVRLTNYESWANSKFDFERLIKLNPSGNFVARDDNKRVGIITTAIFGKLAFVGNLIVSGKFRGQGFGRDLMEHALGYLKKQKDITSIELDGDFPAVELYRKLGFRDKYFSLRFCRKPADNNNSDIENIEPGIVEPSRIIALDYKLINTPNIIRDKFLAEFVNHHNGQIYVSETNGISGFSIIRKCYGDYYVIGPTMADSPKSAELLIQSVVENYSSEVIYAGVPEINLSAVDIMLRNGFCYEQPSLRMYLGDKIDYENNIYTIISGDVG
ncbi:MAG: GNAT family N-acetyltransferase [candidate division Zixibacteria bacterium]|nr:GNAT family N-acetyltransferase [candidate division Zixibacteria bacterium]